MLLFVTFDMDLWQACMDFLLGNDREAMTSHSCTGGCAG